MAGKAAKKAKQVYGTKTGKAAIAGTVLGAAIGNATGSITGDAAGKKAAADKFEKKASKEVVISKANRQGKTYQAKGNAVKDAKRFAKTILSKIPAGRVGRGAVLAGTTAAAGYGAHKLSHAANKPVSEFGESLKYKALGYKKKEAK